ncbi:MAG: hypothetical protein WC703_05415 [Candidatus Neomarinimicrobiota bacterium]
MSAIPEHLSASLLKFFCLFSSLVIGFHECINVIVSEKKVSSSLRFSRSLFLGHSLSIFLSAILWISCRDKPSTPQTDFYNAVPDSLITAVESGQLDSEFQTTISSPGAWDLNYQIVYLPHTRNSGTGCSKPAGNVQIQLRHGAKECRTGVAKDPAEPQKRARRVKGPAHPE